METPTKEDFCLRAKPEAFFLVTIKLKATAKG